MMPAMQREDANKAFVRRFMDAAGIRADTMVRTSLCNFETPVAELLELFMEKAVGHIDQLTNVAIDALTHQKVIYLNSNKLVQCWPSTDGTKGNPT